MFHELPYACRLCKSFLNLEEDDFNYSFDKRDGTTFLLCSPCKKDLEKITEGKLTSEELHKLVRKRWEEGKLKAEGKIEEAKKQGWKIEIRTFGGKSPETINCCQLVRWFNELEEEKKKPQISSFLVILNNLEEKDKLCSNCLEFRNKKLK